MNGDAAHGVACRLQQLSQGIVMLTEKLRGAGFACLKPNSNLAGFQRKLDSHGAKAIGLHLNGNGFQRLVIGCGGWIGCGCRLASIGGLWHRGLDRIEDLLSWRRRGLAGKGRCRRGAGL